MASEHSSKLWFCRLSLNFAQVLEQLLLSWRAEPDAFNKGKLPESCCSRAQDLISRPVVFRLQYWYSATPFDCSRCLSSG